MTFVKVCGISSPEDARVAAYAGTDAVGLLFAESPRRVTVEKANEIASVLPENVKRVGVFVNEEPQKIVSIAKEVGLDMIQLHGEESPEDVSELGKSGLTVIKAFRVRGADSIRHMDEYDADYFLLDAFSKGARGGTGETFDWNVAKTLRGRANIVVSGGLNPENVAEAIRFFASFGVDASSSLEDSPGVKNEEQVRRFVRAAKG